MDANLAFFRLLASPPLDPSVVCHAKLGTPANDTQIEVGTPNRDYILQSGDGHGQPGSRLTFDKWTLIVPGGWDGHGGMARPVRANVRGGVV